MRPGAEFDHLDPRLLFLILLESGFKHMELFELLGRVQEVDFGHVVGSNDVLPVRRPVQPIDIFREGTRAHYHSVVHHVPHTHGAVPARSGDLLLGRVARESPYFAIVMALQDAFETVLELFGLDEEFAALGANKQLAPLIDIQGADSSAVVGLGVHIKELLLLNVLAFFFGFHPNHDSAIFSA